MEEFLVILLQVVVEFLAELLVYAGLIAPFDRTSSRGERGCGILLLFLVFGAVGGAVLNLVSPKLYLTHVGLRVAVLIVGPVAAGFIAYFVSSWRKRLGAQLDPWEHAATAFAFVLAFDVVRFAYAEH